MVKKMKHQSLVPDKRVYVIVEFMEVDAIFFLCFVNVVIFKF